MHPSYYRERVEFSFSIIFYNVFQRCKKAGTIIKTVKKQYCFIRKLNSSKYSLINNYENLILEIRILSFRIHHPVV